MVQFIIIFSLFNITKKIISILTFVQLSGKGVRGYIKHITKSLRMYVKLDHM